MKRNVYLVDASVLLSELYQKGLPETAIPFSVASRVQLDAAQHHRVVTRGKNIEHVVSAGSLQLMNRQMFGDRMVKYASQ